MAKVVGWTVLVGMASFLLVALYLHRGIEPLLILAAGISVAFVFIWAVGAVIYNSWWPFSEW